MRICLTFIKSHAHHEKLTNFASYGNCQEPISCNCLISFDISKLPLYVLEVFFLHPEGVNNQLRRRTVALNI